jgi:peptide/nickel transport system substrate-binding protein
MAQAMAQAMADMTRDLRAAKRRLVMAALLATGLSAALGPRLATSVAVAQPVARELRLTLASEPSSIDPHFHVTTPNLALSTHIFDRLVQTDEKQNLVPGLALSWTAIDPLTWEFKLRPGVKWHDGSPFTAADVVFSMERAGTVPNSPSGFGLYTRGKTFSRVDDLTVRVTTREPYPLMPNDMSALAVVSKKHGEGATTGDYNSGKAAIGTGPYKFSAFVPSDRIEYTANPDYWGEKPLWSKVTLRPVRSGPARVAALLAGDTDVIEDVPTVDIAKLKADPKVAVAQSISYRVVFLQMDQWRDKTPFANAKDGGAIKNPFRDRRVRRAVSLAINREALVARVMEGNAVAASQMLPDSFFGTSPSAKVPVYDPEQAKKLLSDAGLAAGFKVTLHGPAGRYPNDTRIIEAIAQMLNRIGIEATIETMPPSVFFSRASTGADGQPEFSIFLAGWGAASGENSSPLKGLLATFDKDTGLGGSNRGRYSSKAFDEALDQALKTIDLGQVRIGLGKATDIALADSGIIPVLYPLNTWGARKGFAYKARTDEATTAMSVTPTE